MNSASDVLEFWFGRGPWDAARLAERTTFWFGGDGPAAGGDARRRDSCAARAHAGTRGARRVRELGGQSQATAGVDHSVRPGAAQRLSRNTPRRSRSTAKRWRSPSRACNSRPTPRSIRSSGCSSIYRWSMPSRWRRRMPRSPRSNGWSPKRRPTCATTARTPPVTRSKHRDLIRQVRPFSASERGAES